MSGLELSLSPEQKELVAIGASVGAGCHPCVSYHLKGGDKTGISKSRLLSAVASAERVTADAAERMSVHAREQLGPTATSGATSLLDRELAALGAAIAANSIPNIERRLAAAAALGVTAPQLAEAVETAQAVQENAVRLHARETARLLEAWPASRMSPGDDAATDASECADDCPCHAVGAKEAVRSTGSGAAGCSPEDPALGPDQASARKTEKAEVAAGLRSSAASPDDAPMARSIASMGPCCESVMQSPSSLPQRG